MQFHLRRLLPVLVAAAALGPTAPAGAAPVFNAGSVTPDAISPNGDDVQDVAVIQYTIAVPLADVRVLLAAAGGSVVDTLQAFVRQSAGNHALPFDGTTRNGAVPDGSYEIRIFGVGAQGEGTESLALPLLVDRVPPDISEWTLPLGAASTVRNGDLLVLQGCVDADAETILVDLSAIDSGYNPALVSENPIPPDCVVYSYRITAGNALADGDDLPAVLEARDRAGNRALATVLLCLSNRPPSVSEPGSLQNELPFFQNGDEIQVHVGFTSIYPLTVTADLSNLDSQFDPGAVTAVPLGGDRYEVRYRIRTGNTRPDGDYRVRLLATDPGCGAAEDTTVTVTLDNAGINSSLVEDFRATPDAFAPAGNGTKQVSLQWTTLVDSVIVSISTFANLRNPVERKLLTIRPSSSGPLSPGFHTMTWNGSAYLDPTVTPARLEDQTLTLIMRATSIQLDRQRSIFTTLEVDNVLPELKGFPQPGQVVVKNGQVANVPVTFDRPGYAITADFSGVDGTFLPGQSTVVVADSTAGKYGIFYSLSPVISALDSTGIAIPVTARDRAGNTASFPDLVTVCLNNFSPRLVSSRLLENPGPFRNGDRILVETNWAIEPGQEDLVLVADFSAVDDRWNAVTRPATVIDRGINEGTNTHRYDISYTLSAQNQIPGGTDLPVQVTARDVPGAGCGSTRVVAVTVDLDTRAGSAPVFDPVDAVVREALLVLSGVAAGSDSVEILRDGVPVDSFYVDPATNRFSGAVTLAAGENEFVARGFDLAGNVSPGSDPLEVYYTTGTLLTVPPAFRPGSEFFLVLGEPAEAVVLRIYNLAGVEIQRLEGGSGDLYRIPWDGRDHTGSLTSSGPCLLAVELERGGRVDEHLRKAFIFTRNGGSP